MKEQEAMTEKAELQNFPQILEVKFEDNHESGFGFGDGSIKTKEIVEEATKVLDCTQEEVTEIINIYVTTDTSYVTVQKNDDGCGDGRVTIKIIKKNEGGELEETEISFYRAKMFGGGLVMTAAACIGIGDIKDNADSQIEDSIELAKKLKINYGAHDDDHAEGEKSGCGAIDNYPLILMNTQFFKSEIKETLIKILGEAFDDDIFEFVINNYREAFSELDLSKDNIEQLKNSNYVKGYRGGKVKGRILDDEKVVKTLGGHHKEVAVVLNFVKGTTLNQAGLFEVSRGTLQAFSVDVWKMIEYANKISKEYDESSNAKALYSMLIYTLATSATLTDGSQAVYTRQ